MVRSPERLTDNERAALAEIKGRIAGQFSVREFILFGSKARGDASPDSDVDLLIITDRALEYRERRQISHRITEVNLARDTLFSSVVIPAEEWNSRLYEFLPIHRTVEREGVEV